MQFDHLKRREFITFLSGAAAWPLAARAQQPASMPRISVLMGFTERDPEAQAWFAAFREEFHKLGWTEGRNIRIEKPHGLRHSINSNAAPQ
jgi:putative ABC transport system substrate-binding protein